MRLHVLAALSLLAFGDWASASPAARVTVARSSDLVTVAPVLAEMGRELSGALKYPFVARRHRAPRLPRGPGTGENSPEPSVPDEMLTCKDAVCRLRGGSFGLENIHPLPALVKHHKHMPFEVDHVVPNEPVVIASAEGEAKRYSALLPADVPQLSVSDDEMARAMASAALPARC